THYARTIRTIRTCACAGARPQKGAHGHYGQGMPTEAASFPRRHARTQRFTLGAPRSFTVAPDGSRVVSLRSGSGTDRATALWVMDTDAPAGTAPAGSEGAGERVAADPRA